MQALPVELQCSGTTVLRFLVPATASIAMSVATTTAAAKLLVRRPAATLLWSRTVLNPAHLLPALKLTAVKGTRLIVAVRLLLTALELRSLKGTWLIVPERLLLVHPLHRSSILKALVRLLVAWRGKRPEASVIIHAALIAVFHAHIGLRVAGSAE